MEKETQIRNPKHGKSAKKRAGAAMARRIAAGKANLLKFRRTDGTQRLTHGVKALIASGGEIPASLPYAAEIKAEVAAMMSQMESDLGGPDEISAQQRTILQSQRLCLTVLRLASVYLEREGLVNPKSGRPHGLLSVCVSFVNASRLNALSLGLERRARKVGPASLDEYLEQKARESEAKTETLVETESAEVPESEQ